MPEQAPSSSSLDAAQTGAAADESEVASAARDAAAVFGSNVGCCGWKPNGWANGWPAFRTTTSSRCSISARPPWNTAHRQPYIERNIFAPLRARGGVVYHLDMKSDPGVDIVGNLDDPDFRARVSRMQVRSVLISSLLQYLRSYSQVCEMVMSLLPAGGYLFVSGPFSHPHDADPIDTLFRPSIEEVHHCFPGTRIVDSVIIDGGNWRNWDAAERGGRSLGRTVLRLLMPFYRPEKWWEVARQSPFIFKHVTATAVVLVMD